MVRSSKCSLGARAFEDGTWVKAVENELFNLRHLYAPDVDFVFPVRQLCSELEELSGILSQLHGWQSTHWVVDAMIKAGIPFDKLYYEYSLLVKMESRLDTIQFQVGR